ncbi:MAG: F0F1 ATP synthase subunit A, partial [Flavobacteriales bacterium]|nr:F0F1 ATP synthase subunit A [Flavobacteriales bacterium]
MKKRISKLILSLLLIFVSTINIFAENPTSKEEGFNPTPHILHHIADSYEWHLWGDVSISLPVILYTEGNLDVFMSSEFHHGKSKVIRGDRTYKVDHHKIVEENDKKIINVSITKNVASMILSVLILFFILRKVSVGYKNKNQAPKGIQAFLEPLILFVRDDIKKSSIGPKYKRYTVFLLTIFFFILTNNLLGLTPGAANVTGNISVTLVLSLFTFIIIT